MTISTISIIADRVSVATKRSPIAIFKVDRTKADQKFEAVFGATAATIARIKWGDSSFVGEFDNSTDPDELISKLISVAQAA